MWVGLRYALFFLVEHLARARAGLSTCPSTNNLLTYACFFNTLRLSESFVRVMVLVHRSACIASDSHTGIYLILGKAYTCVYTHLSDVDDKGP